MPTFQTEQPITVEIEVGVGDVRVLAGERSETTVEVLPSDPGKRDDVLAAEGTRVEFADGRLLVKTPKNWRRWSPLSDGGAVQVTIELPEGSGLSGAATMGALTCSGRLGACAFTSGMGKVQLDQAGTLKLRTGMGDVTVNHALGDVDVSTGSGKVRIETLDGRSVIKNSNGDCAIGDAGADLRVSTANGDIEVTRAEASVVAKTANGDVRLHELIRGTVAAETAYGALELGIATGTAAYLDLNTAWGELRSELESAGEPEQGTETVDVRAKTAYGDITVRRA